MSIDIADRPVWSRSQVTALSDCERKFAINLKSGRDAALDPAYARAAQLKKVKNRHLWAGSIVHEAIGTLLKTVRQGQPVPESAAFIDGIKIKMRDSFLSSRDGALGSADRLLEHELKLTLSPEVWRGHWNTVESSLKWFFSSKWLERLSHLGPECWKAVDELLEFDVNGIKAYVKIDCAVETDGKFFLIDWKTSNPTTESEPSLLVAALYAHEVWGAEPDQINALAVNIQNGQTFHADVNEDSLMNSHLRIEEEAAALEAAKTRLGKDPFAEKMTANIQNCQRCSYQVLCYPKGIYAS